MLDEQRLGGVDAAGVEQVAREIVDQSQRGPVIVAATLAGQHERRTQLAQHVFRPPEEAPRRGERVQASQSATVGLAGDSAQASVGGLELGPAFREPALQQQVSADARACLQRAQVVGPGSAFLACKRGAAQLERVGEPAFGGVDRRQAGEGREDDGRVGAEALARALQHEPEFIALARKRLASGPRRLAPASAWRDAVVPTRAPAPSLHPCCPAAPNSPTAPSTSARSRSSRSTWAELLRRVFVVDVLTCPQCGGARRFIAQLADPTVVRKLLAHIGHPTEPPRPAPARSPELLDFA